MLNYNNTLRAKRTTTLNVPSKRYEPSCMPTYQALGGHTWTVDKVFQEEYCGHNEKTKDGLYCATWFYSAYRFYKVYSPYRVVETFGLTCRERVAIAISFKP